MDTEDAQIRAGAATSATPISRRSLVAVLAVGAPSCQGADQALFAALRELQQAWRDHDAIWARIDAVDPHPHTHPEIVAAYQRLAEVGLAFADTPARTLSGLVVKLRHIAEDVDEGQTEWFRPLMAGTLADAERMAGM